MIVDEPLLPGPEAIERVTGRRPHYSQFFRWTQYGLRTRAGDPIRLEFVKAGSRRLTSESAVRRFLTANTIVAADNGSRKISTVPSQATSIVLAERLKQEGL